MEVRNSFRRIIASVIIFAMVLTSGGVSTFATSITNLTKKETQEADKRKELTYKYYKELKYESQTLLLNNDGENADASQVQNNITNKSDVEVTENTKSGDTESGKVDTKANTDEASTRAEKMSASDENTDISDTDNSSFDVQNNSDENNINDNTTNNTNKENDNNDNENTNSDENNIDNKTGNNSNVNATNDDETDHKGEKVKGNESANGVTLPHKDDEKSTDSETKKVSSDSDVEKDEKGTTAGEEKEADDNNLYDENGNIVDDKYESDFEEIVDATESDATDENADNEENDENDTATESEATSDDENEGENADVATDSEAAGDDDIATESDAEENDVATESDADLDDIATESDVEENDEATASDLETMATISEIENTTLESDMFLGNLATASDVDDTATFSEVDSLSDDMATDSNLKTATDSLFGKTNLTLPIYYQMYDENDESKPIYTLRVNSGFSINDTENVHIRLENKIHWVEDYMPNGYEKINDDAKIGWGLMGTDKYGEISKSKSSGIMKNKSINRSTGWNDGNDLGGHNIGNWGKDRWSHGMDIEWRNYRFVMYRLYNIVGQTKKGSHNWLGTEYWWEAAYGSNKGTVKFWTNSARSGLPVWEHRPLSTGTGGTINGVNLDYMEKSGEWYIGYNRSVTYDDVYFVVKVKLRRKKYDVVLKEVDENWNLLAEKHEVMSGNKVGRSSSLIYNGFLSEEDRVIEYKSKIDSLSLNSWIAIHTTGARDNCLDRETLIKNYNAGMELEGVYDSNKRKVSFPFTFYGNTTYYVRWKYVVIDIDRDLNGGTLSSWNTGQWTRKYNEGITQNTLPSSNQIVRYGYTLDYWVNAADNKKIDNLGKDTKTKYKVKPIWKKNKVTLKSDWAKSITKENITSISFDVYNGTAPDKSKEFLISGDSSMTGYLNDNKITIYADATNKKVYADSSIESAFEGFSNLTTISFGGKLALSNVTNMKKLFANCPKLENVDIKSCDFDNVTDTSYMFSGDKALKNVVFAEKSLLNAVTNATSMFENCENLESVTFGYNSLKNTENVSSMFKGCKKLKSLTFKPQDRWMNIKNASSMFEGCESLTDTNSVMPWNYDNIENVNNLFKGAKALTSANLKDFKLSNIKNAASMFENCENLTKITADENFTGLTSSTNMFKGCTKLVGGSGYRYNEDNVNGTLARVDLGGILPGYLTFNDSAYNKLKIEIGSIKVPDTEKANIKTIKIDNPTGTIKNYDREIILNNSTGLRGQIVGDELYIHFSSKIAKLTGKDSLESAFEGLTELTSIDGLDKINMGDVTSMKSMFKGDTKLTTIGGLNSFNTAKVTDMSSMFENCESLSSIEVHDFNTSNVTNTSSMFKNAKALSTLNLKKWNVGKLTSANEMFNGATALTRIDVAKANSNWTGVKSSTDMFKDCTILVGMSAYSYDPAMTGGIYARAGYGYIAPGYFTCDDSTFYDNVKFYMSNDFFKSTTKNKSDIDSINIRSDNTRLDKDNTDEHFLMDAEAGTWGYIVGDSFMTSFAPELKKLFVKNDMSNMFADFENATTISGLENLNTEEVTNMSGLFKNDKELTTVDAYYLDTKNVVDMSHMFDGCANLTTLNLSGLVGTSNKTLDTSKVENMSYMFASASSITTISLDNFDFSNVNNAEYMFSNATALTTIKVTGNVRMFGSAPVNAHSGTGTGTSTSVNTTNMFGNCTSLVGGAGYEWTDTHIDGEFARLDYGGIMPGYFTTDDYSVVPKIYLGHDFLSAAQKNTYQNIEIVKGPIGGTVGVDVEEIELYEDTTHNGRVLAYKDGATLRIAFGDVGGTTIDKLYGAADFSEAFSGFNSVEYITGLNNIDTSEVLNMSKLFMDDTHLREVDLSTFVLSNVQNASYMFNNCETLGDTSITFDTTDTMHLFGLQLRNTEFMFAGCNNITNLDLSKFKMSNVEDMHRMFDGMTNLANIKFPAGFGSKAANMNYLFADCTSLTSLDLNNFNTSSAEDMRGMFSGCSSLVSLNLQSFSTARVEYMEHMFYNCRNLKYIYSDDFDVTSLTDTGVEMFLNCDVLDGGNGTRYIDFTSVTDVSYAKIDRAGSGGDPGYFRAPNMYKLGPDWDYNAAGVAQVNRNNVTKISFVEGVANEPTYTTSWDIPSGFGLKGYVSDDGQEVIIYAASESSVKPIYAAADSGYLFGEETDTNKMWTNLTEIENLTNLDTSKIIYMNGMFANSTALTEIDLSGFNTVNVNSMKDMFKNVEEVEELDLTQFDTDLTENMSGMFSGAKKLSKVTLPANFGNNAADMSYMFANDSALAFANSTSAFDISNINTGRASDMSYMFYNAASISTIILPVRNFGAAATNMSHMFDGAVNILDIDTTRFNVGNAVDLSYMFASMSEIGSLDISAWNVGNVTNMSYMFANDNNITTFRLPDATNLTSVLDISYMLSGLTNLTDLILPKFENVTNMEGLLKGDDNLANLAMEDYFVHNKVTNIKSMFEGNTSLIELNLNTWVTSEVTDMTNMFKGCSNLATIKANAAFDTTKVVASDDMFDGCVNLIGHEGTAYDNSYPKDKTYARLDSASTHTPGYFTGSEYSFGPGWSVGLLDKSIVTTINFDVAMGAVPTGDENFVVAGGLQAVRTGQALNLYKSKANIDVMLAADSSKLFEGFDNVTSITGLDKLNSSNVTNMEEMFANLPNLTTTLNISSFNTDKVTNMKGMFRGNPELQNIILPNIFGRASTDMSSMFEGDKNLDLNYTESSKFVTDNVVDFSHMFEGCEAITQLMITNFNTSTASNMKAMFKNLSGITNPAFLNVSSFDTSKVTDMSEMFMGVSNINILNVGNFDTSAVTDMSHMFDGMSSLTSVNLTSFDTSATTDMSYLFNNAENVRTIDISSFDTGAVTNMSHMFGGMKKLTNIILSNTNVNLFNTANVTNMSHMFAETKLTDYSYILGREAFNTGNVADMSYMFASASEVSSLNLRSFDVSSLTNVAYMFAGASNLDNVDFPDEFITNVTDASGLFKGTAFTTLNLTEFNTSNATNMSYMFADMTNLTTIEVSDTFNTDNVSVINSENMFLNTLNIIGFAGTKYDSSHVDKYYAVVDGSVDSTGTVRKGYFTTGTYTIYPNWYEGTENKSSISEIHITKYPESAPTGADDEWVMKGGLQGYRVGDIVYIYINKDKRAYMAEDSEGLFSDFKNVTVLDGLDNLITTKVNNMSSMFEGLESLVSIDLTSFDTSTVSNMKSMFKGMKSLTTLDITNFDTSKVTDMSHMFEDVESLSSLDLTRVVTGEVRDMSYMFKGMKNISSLELVDFNTEKVENMSFMFSGMTNATSINTEFFNTENVRSMSAMFDGCENLLEAKVARFNTSKVTNMAYMFDGAKSLENIDLRSFNVSNVLSFNSMFNNVSSVSELDLFSFVPTSATDASNMFKNMTKLTTIYASARFELATTVSSSGMFASASNLVGGAGTVYSDMHTDSEYARLDKGAVRPGYFSGQYYFAHLFAMGGTFADGTDEKVVKIYGDEPTNKFEIPTYKGYTFDNYYVAGSVINDTWIYSTEKETAVIARWTPKDYKIYYTSGGGVGTMEEDIVSFGSTITLKNNTFTKEGYDFNDWSIDGVGLSKIMYQLSASGQTISDYVWNYVIDKNVTNITLTAMWTPKTYTIVYNGNEGATITGDTEYIENNIDYGSTHTLYENQFVRDGWTFNGWSIHSADSDRKYGDKAEFNLAGYTQTINLYAKWIKTDAIYGKLILHGNGGKVNGLDDDEILLTRYNTVPKAEVKRIGYSFVHWSSGSDIVEYPEVCDFKEMELIAEWKPINYNVRYYSNDGTDYYTEFIATYNEPFKIRDYEESNRFGYKFIGWTDDPYGTTVKYNVDTEVENLVDAENKTFDFYAVWQGKEYKITLHNQDPKTNADKEMTFTYGENKRIVEIATDSYIDETTGASFVFGGWATDSSATNAVYYNNHNADTIYENIGLDIIDLYPVWIDSAMTVYLTFDANGGTINGAPWLTVAVKSGEKIPYPTKGTLKYNNYVFDKWTTERNGSVEFNDIIATFTADTTIYADWISGKFSLKYVGVNATGGTDMATISDLETANSIIISDSTYTRLGYKFVGWDTKPSAKTVVYEANDEVRNIANDGDVIKLYTVWEANNYTITYFDVNGDLIGRNTLNYEDKVVLLSNQNIHIGHTDAGFTYTDGIISKTFTSGQVVSKDDFVIDETTNLSNGIILNGVETEEIYEVTYKVTNGHFADGSDAYVATQSYGEALKKPADPISDKGKNFLAWGIRKGSAINPYYSTTYDFDENKTFESIWEFDNYTAILDANGGEFVNGALIKDETLKLGESTKKLEVPIKHGHKFVEYYVDDEEMHDTWDYISEDTTTLKAKWQPINYYISYNPNGGEGAMSVDIATYGEPYKIRESEFVRDGYRFKNWESYFSINTGFLGKRTFIPGAEEKYFSNNTIQLDNGNVASVPVDGEIIELKAMWEPLTFTVNYELNLPEKVAGAKIGENEFGVSAGNASLYSREPQEFTYGSEENQIRRFSLFDVKCPGYVFAGWALSPDSTVVYADESTFGTNDMYNENVTLYAVWKPEKEIYGLLTLDSNGGRVNGSDTFCDMQLSIGEPIPKPTLEKEGYRFTHWTEYDPELDEVVIASYPDICNFEDRILTANWEPINYKIRLYENLNESSNYEEIDATYDEPVNIPDWTGRNQGEDFLGFAYGKRDVLTVVGHYDFDIDYVGGRIQKIYVPPENGTVVNIGTPSVPGQIVNLYGIWDGKSYVITQHDELHDKKILGVPIANLNSYIYGYGGRIDGVKEKIATVNNIPYVFSGWATSSVALDDPMASNKVAFYDGQNSDNIYELSNKLGTTLYAVWIRKASGSTVVFDAGDGRINEDKRRTVKFTYQDKLLFPDDSEMSRRGYKFGGWYDTLKGITYQSTDDVLIDFAGDRVLKAVWIPGQYTINYNKSSDEVEIVPGHTVSADGNYYSETWNGDVKTVISNNNTFTRPGYEFLGWDVSEEAKTVIYERGAEVEPISEVDTTINLYAVWQPKYYTINYYNEFGVLFASNSILVGKNVRIIPNEGMTDATQDAGYTYVVDGETYHFSSGQSVSSTDLGIVKAQTNGGVAPVVAPTTTGGDSTFGSGESTEKKGLFTFISELFGQGAKNTNKYGYEVKDDNLFGAPSSLLGSSPLTTGSLNLYGETAPATYKLTFDANGGAYSDGTFVKYASAENGDEMDTKYPEDPTNGNTAFLGWSVDSDSDGVYEEYTKATYSFTESMDFYAIWDKDFKAILHAAGGTYSDGTDEMIVPIDIYSSTDKFEEPMRVGYKFNGYVLDDGSPLNSTWTYKMKEYLDLYATWTPINYKVEYVAGGGVGFMTTEIATYDSIYTLANNSFTKEGYEFDGWTIDGATIYNEGDTVSNLVDVEGKVVTFVALWRPLTYSITYYGNGGVTSLGDSQYSETGLTYGVDHTILPNEFTKSNFTFRGWGLATDSNVTYMDGATILKNRPYETDIKLYANWIRDTEKYGTLVLNAGGGLINGVSIATMSYRVEEAITIPTVERVGYTFNGWTDATGAVATLPRKWNAAWAHQVKEYTANWTVNHYNVRYYSDEKANTYLEDANIAYDIPFTVRPKSDLTKLYWTNDKWTAYKAGLKVEYIENTYYEKLSEKDGDIINIYANWIGDNYTITLHDTDPENAGRDITTNYTYGNKLNINSVTKKIATISDVEMAFAGWATSSTANKVVYYDSISADLVYELEGNNTIDLWPVWVESSKLIYLTFDGNGGKVNGRDKWTVPFATDSEIVYPGNSNVKRFGYQFTGNWLDAPAGSVVTKVYADFSTDSTIYAEWDDTRTYRLNYVAVGDNVQGSMSFENKRAVRNVNLTNNAYRRLGYTFAGWDISPDANKVVYRDGETGVAPLGDAGDVVNLYTVWTANTYTITYYDIYNNEMGTSFITYGNTATLLQNTVVPRGSIDKGWTDVSGSLDAKFSSGQRVKGSDLGITSTTDLATGIKLYALTDRITYIATFDANVDGKYDWNTGDPADEKRIKTRLVHYGDLMSTIYPDIPTRSYIDSITGNLIVSEFNGYTVDGLYYWSNTYDFIEAKTFLALWDETPYLINFHANEPNSPDPTMSNTATGTMTSQAAFSDIPFHLKHNDFNIPGYEFIGWTTSSTVAAQSRLDNTYAENYVAGLIASGTYDDEIIEDGPEFPELPGAATLSFTRAARQDIDLYALWGRSKTRVLLIQNEAKGKFTIYDPYVVSDPANAKNQEYKLTGTNEIIYATMADIYYDSYLYEYPMFDSGVRTRGSYIPTGYFTTVRMESPLDRYNFNTYSYGGDLLTETTLNRYIGSLELYPLWKNATQMVSTIYDHNTAEWEDNTLHDQFVGYVDAPYFTEGEGNDPKDGTGRIFDLLGIPEDVRIFSHWSENSDGTATISETTIYTGANTEIYGNIRFRDNYVVSYQGNGGVTRTGATSYDQIMVEGIADHLTPNQFLKTGYSFDKWKDVYGTSTYSDAAEVEKPMMALTLLAEWTMNPITPTDDRADDPTPTDPTDPTDDTTPDDGNDNRGRGSRVVGGPGGGGGGGGSGAIAGTAGQAADADLLVLTEIAEYDTKWVVNDEGIRVGVKVRKDSVAGKAIMNSLDIAALYMTIDDPDYIRLKGGFFNIVYKGSNKFYAFSPFGELLTGFIKTKQNMPIYVIDGSINKIKQIGQKDTAKYYLYENIHNDIEYAKLWSTTITLLGVTYEFDGEGRVIKETGLTNGVTKDVDSAWEYDPVKNKWRYYDINADGERLYIKNKVHKLPIGGTDYYYMFDEEGYMKTGLTTYNGDTYYLEEEGSLKGTIYVGEKMIGGKKYVFNGEGKLVTGNNENLLLKTNKEKEVARENNNLYVESTNTENTENLPKVDTDSILPVNLGEFVGRVLKFSK